MTSDDIKCIIKDMKTHKTTIRVPGPLWKKWSTKLNTLGATLNDRIRVLIEQDLIEAKEKPRRRRG